MTRAREAALELMLLRERYSEADIREAIALLASGGSEDMIAFLVSAFDITGRVARGRSGGSSDQRKDPRVVEALRDKEPEKYQVLSAFYREAAGGQFTLAQSEIESVGRTLSKEFKPAKKRQDNIVALIGLLARQDLATIRNTLDRLKRSAPPDENTFRRLAGTIMGTTPNGTAED